MYKKLITVVGLVCLLIGVLAAENPEAVSPGHELRAVIVNEVCPTFSWAQLAGASAYQIAVFEMNERYEGLSYYERFASLGNPVLIQKISGTASSWTPSFEEALQNGGHYVWFVQAQDAYGTGVWSVGKKFAVRASLGLTEIREKVKKQLEARGIDEEVIDEAFEGIESQDIQSKKGGELIRKVQEEREEAAQTKLKAQGNEEIRSKENQTITATNDITAGTLGSEGDVYSNVYYGTGTDNSLPGSAYYNSFFGYYAGYNTGTGDRNTFVGYTSGYSNTSGKYNTFIGYRTGYSNTAGYHNTFIGYRAGDNSSSSSSSGSNTFLGYYAGYSNTTGRFNTYLGANAGAYNTTGENNTFLGYWAGYSNVTGSGNVFLGMYAGYNEIGSQKLYIDNSDTSSPLIYGEFNNDLVTINGHLSVHNGGYLGLTGDTNQLTVDTTSKRARFKLQADGGGTNTDDFFNFTMRNDYSDVTLSVRDSSAGVWLPMLSYEYLNNKVDFKDNDIVTTGTISSGGGAYTSGGAWIEASSRDYKENIMELDQAESLQALTSLNPVRYNYKNKRDEEFLGFIAEDVPQLVAMNGRRGMRAKDIVAVLTKVVQDQQKTINKQKNKNIKQDKVLKDQNELLKVQIKIINELKERIKELERK